MRILDKDNKELTNIDYTMGKAVKERILVKKHPKKDEIKEVFHYEVEKTYPNGGKDYKKVIDVVGKAACDAWDEYEDIIRYIPYTQEELKAMEAENKKPTAEDRLKELEQAFAAFKKIVNAFMGVKE